MVWEIKYLNDAKKDLKKMDNSQKLQVLKAIKKVSVNPLPKNEGGYGSLLRNQTNSKLKGFCKIKLKKIGIRVVYRLIIEDNIMKIIIISARADDEVYIKAEERINKTTE